MMHEKLDILGNNFFTIVTDETEGHISGMKVQNKPFGNGGWHVTILQAFALQFLLPSLSLSASLSNVNGMSWGGYCVHTILLALSFCLWMLSPNSGQSHLTEG